MMWQIVRGVEISKRGRTLFGFLYTGNIYFQCCCHWRIEINILWIIRRFIFQACLLMGRINAISRSMADDKRLAFGISNPVHRLCGQCLLTSETFLKKKTSNCLSWISNVINTIVPARSIYLFASNIDLQRMPQNRIPLKSYYNRPQGRGTIGRPKKWWREQL